MSSKVLNHIPVSFFSMAVGSLAWGQAWQAAALVWPQPPWVLHLTAGVGLLVWLTILLAYTHKWWHQPRQARLELDHPIQSTMVALGPVSTLLAAMSLKPLAPALAWALFVPALVAQLLLGLWIVGRFWQGGRTPVVNASLYLPSVAQNFVAATAAATFGWTSVAALFFGAGLFSWLSLESLVTSHAATQAPLDLAHRPIQGIQVAPAVVGGLSYLALTSGPPDLVAQMLLGYGLYQALLAMRLLSWTRQARFAPTYWAFSFGVMALASVALRILARAPNDPVWPCLAPVLFGVANLVFFVLLWHTGRLVLQGRLLPPMVSVHLK